MRLVCVQGILNTGKLQTPLLTVHQLTFNGVVATRAVFRRMRVLGRAEYLNMRSLIACECLGSPCSLQAPPLQQEQHSSSMTVLVRSFTAAATTAAAPALFDQLDKALKSGEGKELVAKTKASSSSWPAQNTQRCADTIMVSCMHGMHAACRAHL